MDKVIEEEPTPLCTWCGNTTTPITGKDINVIDPFIPSVEDQKDDDILEGKTHFIVREQHLYACSQNHALLYKELPPPMCHYPKPHKCKIEKKEICINQVICNCPAKHIFCSEAAKSAFYNLAPLIVIDDDDGEKPEDLSAFIGAPLPISSTSDSSANNVSISSNNVSIDNSQSLSATSLVPVDSNEKLEDLGSLLTIKPPLITQYLTLPQRKEVKRTMKRIPSTLDFDKICETCKCGYGKFKKCIRCSQENCYVCHAMNKCSNCSNGGWTQWSKKVTGIQWLSTVYYNYYRVNEYPNLCPHCYKQLEPSYLLSPCGHLACMLCGVMIKNNKSKCSVCSVKVTYISIVYLKYWGTKDINTRSLQNKHNDEQKKIERKLQEIRDASAI